MKIYKKLIIFSLLFCLCISSLSIFAEATASQSYLYDNWGKSIPAPTAYTIGKIFTGQSFSVNPFEDPEDIFVADNGNIYIVDSGQSNIIELDSNFKLIRVIKEFYNEDTIDTFSKPTGIYVDKNGFIYVADSENKRVVELDKNLKKIRFYEKPKTDLIDSKAEFKPEKVVVDSIGNVYVVSYGIYQGLIKYDKNGIFQGFFGGNRVEVTADLLMKQLWKKMFTDEQAQATSRSLPIEYSNVAIDNSGFIYAVVMQTKTSRDEVKKLNSQGKNVLRYSNIGTHYERNDFGDIEKDYTNATSYKDNRMVDVCIGKDGNMALLDGERGHIFIYDQDCNLLFTFGTIGSNRGDFGQPVSIAKSGDKYLILDSIKKCIMVYQPTDYSRQVSDAMKYYSDGKYIDSVALWENVIKKNSNCMIAYKSIGKAYLQQGKYKTAMKYFKYSDDKEGYSSAYSEYRKQYVRDNILFIIAGIVLIIIFIKILSKAIPKLFGFKIKKVKTIYK